jgi:multicomponent Na+:H+ antiporter subunit D
MLLPAALLLGASVGLEFLPRLEPGVGRAARLFVMHDAYAAAVLDGAARPQPAAPAPLPSPGALERMLPPLAALAIAGMALFQGRLRPLPVAATGRLIRILLGPLQTVHSGHVGDYVSWLVFGTAELGSALFLPSGREAHGARSAAAGAGRHASVAPPAHEWFSCDRESNSLAQRDRRA